MTSQNDDRFRGDDRPAAAPEASAVEAALALAERKGFRLAVVGRTCALTAIAFFYLVAFPFSHNLRAGGAILAEAALGLASLALVRTRLERFGRFAFFAFDATAIGAMLALVPISSSGEVPQNFVFLSSRHNYYYVLVALSVLTLSPGLVLWTGLRSVLGLAGATAWIASGMERISSYGDLPPSPSREDFFAVVFNPDFLALPIRANESLVIAISTCIAALAVHRARNVVRAHAAGEAKRSRLQQLFGRYVPAQVAAQLLDEGQLAPQQREASVLFADIEGFTRLTQHLPPVEVIGLLDGFFGATTSVIEEQGGVVVNHLGDAVIAAFNAPLPVEDHAARAVDAARSLQSLVRRRTFEGHRLRVRVGIATGPVAAGTLGGTTRQTYTLYGDTVNLAQRLERLNKELGTDCLISGATFAAARSSCTDAAPAGSVQVPGRDGSVEAYALSPRAA